MSESLNGDRTYILNALRRTARPGECVVEGSLEDTPGRSKIPDADLEDRLSTALQTLGAHFHRAHSEEEVRRILSTLIHNADAHKIAVLSDAFLRTFHLDRLTEEAGVTVISYSEEEISDSVKDVTPALKDAELGIFPVSRALAQSGTMVLNGNAGVSRAISLIPPIIVGILDKKQIVADLGNVFSELIETGQVPSRPGDWMVCISGPSRTADIEATLTTGIHGPGDTHLIVLG
ncbi:MAG: LUD domain-containing protein [Deltaproteobacteria bacterium]|nr:LUD domain-containing protein [Deltaproteobacteria bacterium]